MQTGPVAPAWLAAPTGGPVVKPHRTVLPNGKAWSAVSIGQAVPRVMWKIVQPPPHSSGHRAGQTVARRSSHRRRPPENRPAIFRGRNDRFADSTRTMRLRPPVLLGKSPLAASSTVSAAAAMWAGPLPTLARYLKNDRRNGSTEQHQLFWQNMAPRDYRAQPRVQFDDRGCPPATTGPGQSPTQPPVRQTILTATVVPGCSLVFRDPNRDLKRRC